MWPIFFAAAPSSLQGFAFLRRYLRRRSFMAINFFIVFFLFSFFLRRSIYDRVSQGCHHNLVPPGVDMNGWYAWKLEHLHQFSFEDCSRMPLHGPQRSCEELDEKTNLFARNVAPGRPVKQQRPFRITASLLSIFSLFNTITCTPLRGKSGNLYMQLHALASFKQIAPKQPTLAERFIPAS